MKLYQYGSSLKYNILGKSDKCKDFDYIVECNSDHKREILEKFIHMIADEVTTNSFGGFKLKMKSGAMVDIDFCRDLSVEYRRFMELNSDGIFYDVIKDQFFFPERFYKDYIYESKVYVIDGAISHPNNTGRSIDRMAHAIALQPLLLLNDNKHYRNNKMLNIDTSVETQLLLELIVLCNLKNVIVVEHMHEYYREIISLLDVTEKVNEKLK